ncbi:hypothetical protein D5018_19490 [Parashewanella curva]|uniref:Uncharacterized protein n=1 Tax=Parashewanella curva TaxID=2338552 RepID=A0A3L8PRJ8_9GAMM|nr:hypothetical protein D5018_19490 [Parashewanella curva]
MEFAELLYCYHNTNSEQTITSIITGYHGEDILKDGMIEFLKNEFGLEFVEYKINKGILILSKSKN